MSMQLDAMTGDATAATGEREAGKMGRYVCCDGSPLCSKYRNVTVGCFWFPS